MSEAEIRTAPQRSLLTHQIVAGIPPLISSQLLFRLVVFRDGWHDIAIQTAAFSAGYFVFALIVYKLSIHRMASRQQERRRYIRGGGKTYKAIAVINASSAICVFAIGAEPITQSAWAPSGHEWWVPWIIAAIFWMMALLSFATGEALAKAQNEQHQIDAAVRNSLHKKFAEKHP